VLVSAGLQESVTRRVRENHLLPWEQEIMLHTSPGEALLEVGSGTGEMSLALAQAGRRVSILDISPESVAFVQRCARRLGLEVSAVCADATQPLPFGDDAFDCVWSSGLLDRVDPRQRRAMIAEFARMSRDRVIVMVANAACVAYRAGMMAQQQSGTWPYGLETPLLSLRADFDMAGLCVDAEYSVGARHALEFLPAEHPMRPALERWMRGLSEEDLQKHHQGYLLVTVGRRAKGGEAC
jgi:SAM-dependent methyltransferase